MVASHECAQPFAAYEAVMWPVALPKYAPHLGQSGTCAPWMFLNNCVKAVPEWMCWISYKASAQFRYWAPGRHPTSRQTDLLVMFFYVLQPTRPARQLGWSNLSCRMQTGRIAWKCGVPVVLCNAPAEQVLWGGTVGAYGIGKMACATPVNAVVHIFNKWMRWICGVHKWYQLHDKRKCCGADIIAISCEEW